jgi:hypothetical protein
MKNYHDLNETQRELYLYAMNNGRLYGLRSAADRTLEKRIRKGVFDCKKAPKAYRGFVDAAAKSYHDEFCGADQYALFTTADRVAVAEAIAATILDEIGCGNSYL